MPPIGIFKCPHISDHDEDPPPAEEHDPTRHDEWDTPTRVRVKIMTQVEHSRQSIERQTKVPVRFQQRILKEPDRRNGEDGENGRNSAGALHKLSKRHPYDDQTPVEFAREQADYLAAARARLRWGMSP
jgi:hypothetical protein